MLLPKINELLLALLKGAKYFTAVDVCSGYYHSKLDEEFIAKSAFTTVFGKFTFLRLPLWFISRPILLIHLIYDLFWT